MKNDLSPRASARLYVLDSPKVKEAASEPLRIALDLSRAKKCPW